MKYFPGENKSNFCRWQIFLFLSPFFFKYCIVWHLQGPANYLVFAVKEILSLFGYKCCTVLNWPSLKYTLKFTGKLKFDTVKLLHLFFFSYGLIWYGRKEYVVGLCLNSGGTAHHFNDLMSFYFEPQGVSKGKEVLVSNLRVVSWCFLEFSC